MAAARLADGFVRELMIRQSLGITLAVNDSVNNGHPGDARDVAHHVLQLQIHLAQGLLHVLNVLRRVFGEHRTLTQIHS